MTQFDVELQGGPYPGLRSLRTPRSEPPHQIPIAHREPADGSDPADAADTADIADEPVTRVAVYRYSSRRPDGPYVYRFAGERPRRT